MVLGDLDITMQTRLALNLQQSSCLSLLGTEIAGVHHPVLPNENILRDRANALVSLVLTPYESPGSPCKVASELLGL